MNEEDKFKLEFLTKAIHNLNACFPELPFFISLEPKPNVAKYYKENSLEKLRELAKEYGVVPLDIKGNSKGEIFTELSEYINSIMIEEKIDPEKMVEILREMRVSIYTTIKNELTGLRYSEAKRILTGLIEGLDYNSQVKY